MRQPRVKAPSSTIRISRRVLTIYVKQAAFAFGFMLSCRPCPIGDRPADTFHVESAVPLGFRSAAGDPFIQGFALASSLASRSADPLRGCRDDRR